MIDLDRLRATSLVTEPFDHLIVPCFIEPKALESVLADFPAVRRGGSFPVSVVSYGPAFGALLDELRGSELRKAVEDKFALDLSARPTMLTVRGWARAKDGRIHTDSRTKILTVLIYVNRSWTDPGGRLRLLRSPENLDDYAAEVFPEGGVAVFFRCTDRAWHGHTPFMGERRVLQLNWVTDDAVVRREQRRHRVTARLKRWLPL